jgi:hypothetical protein
MSRADKDAVRSANPVERTIPELLGEQPIQVGGELKVRCPWHEDKRPSLRINPIKGVWHCDPCRKGGDVFEFVQEFNKVDFPTALEILEQRAGGRSRIDTATRRIVATYDYRDEANVLLYQTVRYEPKDFRQRRPHGHGEWVWKVDDVRRVLYRLPELQGREAVLVLEGEKDVDRAWQVGLPATCNVGGAGKWRDEYSEQLAAAGTKRVVVVPDQDAPGRSHADGVARSCLGAGLTVRMVPLPDLSEKGDLSDYLATHSKADLVAVLKAAPAYAPPPEPSSSVFAEIAADREDEDDPAPVSTWPAPLSRAAYVGIFGDVVDALAPQTEADPAALLVQLLTMFGNVIGRTAHFRVEADTHYLNLFLALVGASSKGRKGVSAGRALRLFGPVDEGWTKDRQGSGLSSGEGLIHAVRDALEVQKPVRVSGRIVDYETVIEDHGVADKRLYVNEAELASVLKVMMREGNTLSPIVRNAWDGQTLRTMTKNSPLKATGPHISVVGSISQHEVRRYLDATESANGFGNRFLWVCVKRAQYLPDGGGFVPLDPLVERLRVLVSAAREAGEMQRDAAARRLWHEEYRRLSAGRPGLLGSITGRAEAQTMRLACLYTLGDGARTVGERHLRAALEVWRYCFDSAAYVFGEALGDTKADAGGAQDRPRAGAVAFRDDEGRLSGERQRRRTVPPARHPAGG